MIDIINDFLSIDDDLEQIFKIRPMIQDCLLYRASINEYQKMMKQAMMTEMKNLFNVEMIIDQIELKLLRKEQLPPITETSGIGPQV